MNDQPSNSSQLAKGKESLIAINVADALLLLYKSVKERKVKELVKEMENGGSKYGKCTGNISL